MIINTGNYIETEKEDRNQLNNLNNDYYFNDILNYNQEENNMYEYTIENFSKGLGLNNDNSFLQDYSDIDNLYSTYQNTIYTNNKNQNVNIKNEEEYIYNNIFNNNNIFENKNNINNSSKQDNNNIKEEEKELLSSKDISSLEKIYIKNENNSNNINNNKIFFKISNNYKNSYHRKNNCYKIFSQEEKKIILKDLKKLSNKEVSKKYKVSIRNITRWKKSGIIRKKGSGRRFMDPYLEKKIMKWYYSQNPINITSKIFREKAKEICKEKSFKASTGWLVRIKAKYKINFERY